MKDALLVAEKNAYLVRYQLAREVSSVWALMVRDRSVYALIIALVSLISAFTSFSGYKNEIDFFSYASILPIAILCSLALSSLSYLVFLIVRFEKRPLLCFWLKIKAIWQARAYFIAGFALLSVLSAFISSFSTMKGMIPIIVPFQFDDLFHRLDVLLFFGVEPWRWTHSILQSPLSILILNIFYNVWFILLWITLSYYLCSYKNPFRKQYLISWVLCWFLLGIVLATLFSSVGPAFVQRLDPSNDVYSELMSLLQTHHTWLVKNDWFGLWALNTQDELWNSYKSGKDMLGSGISAMPSMHVSMAVLMALGGWKINRWLGALLWSFSGIIFVGSFSLGWHYAVDGLVSLPLTVAIWYLVGKCINTRSYAT
ncbi:phosphatase PAP2 family protein [Vibrio atypicus]|uniref:phosphatase PAP2 family protein n=1 Tax=Vibrio atypicus TaxID=558271 RepID=UPI001CED3C44|nr:phosphatase PAP2 family protein [Vibrio atypicus]